MNAPCVNAGPGSLSCFYITVHDLVLRLTHTQPSLSRTLSFASPSFSAFRKTRELLSVHTFPLPTPPTVLTLLVCEFLTSSDVPSSTFSSNSHHFGSIAAPFSLSNPQPAESLDLISSPFIHSFVPHSDRSQTSIDPSIWCQTTSKPWPLVCCPPSSSLPMPIGAWVVVELLSRADSTPSSPPPRSRATLMSFSEATGLLLPWTTLRPRSPLALPALSRAISPTTGSPSSTTLTRTRTLLMSPSPVALFTTSTYYLIHSVVLVLTVRLKAASYFAPLSNDGIPSRFSHDRW